MKTIAQLSEVAASFRDTKIWKFITAFKLGQLFMDIIEYVSAVDKNANSMSVRKTYLTYSAMLADTSPTYTIGGVTFDLKFGQTVAVTSDSTQSNIGIYRLTKPGWEKVSSLGDIVGVSQNRGYSESQTISQKFITNSLNRTYGYDAANAVRLLKDSKIGLISANNKGFLTTSGEVVLNDDYRTTDLIQLERLRNCNLKGLYYIQNLQYPIAFYKSDGSFINCYSPVTESGNVEFDLTDSLISNHSDAYFVKLCTYSGISIKYKYFKNVITVGEKDCDFNTIQQAIDNCEDSENNPITIFVYPGVYSRFSMIDLENRLRYISIVGFNKNLTIVADNTGNYYTPPAEIRTSGLIKGLTFKATHEEETTATPGHITSYAVHMDFGPQDVTFDDCFFYSENGCAVGIGTHQDERIEFHNCDFDSNISAAYWQYAYLGDYGALFIHSAVNGENITNQNIVMKNCNVISRNPLATYSAFLTSISETFHFSPHINASIIGCTFRSGKDNSAKIRMEFILNPDSHSNNNSNLNIVSNSSILS